MVLGRMNAAKAALMLAVSVGAVTAVCGQASAGAFLLREQSAGALGLSTAGAAAGGGGLGSAFWNGATITDYAGWQSSWSVTGIMPDSRMTAKAGSTLYGLPGVSTTSGDIVQDAILPSGVTSYQLNDKIWLGLAINTPFGLTTSAPDKWTGSGFGITTKIVSYDLNPSIAYKVTDTLSVSVGLQAMYFKAYLRKAIDEPGLNLAPGSPFSGVFHDASVTGDSWGYGVTLGATWKPVDGTELGFGYRSAVRQKVSGTINFSETIPIAQPLPVGSYPARLALVLPDIVTLGLKQNIAPDLTLLAGFEWDHWNVNQDLAVTSPSTGAAFETIPVRYKNGWLASLGAEYAWSPALMLRAGLAYEKSPIDNTNRLPILPDSDRIWTSIGAGWKITEKLTADFSYAHLFAKNGTINQTAANPAPLPASTLLADVKSHVDIVSVGLTYRFDDPAPRPRDTLVRKY